MSKAALYLRGIRRVLFETSHLSKYLPIMAQTEQNKVRRIIADPTDLLKQKQALQIQNLLVSGPLPKLRIFSPLALLSLAWFSIVFCSVIYFYVQVGLVLTYGTQVWQQQLTNGIALSAMILATITIVFDIAFRFNCGFLYRGMIIMDRRRIVERYVRGQFVSDVIAAIILIAVPISHSYYLNYAKLFLIFKLLRLSEIDDFFMRKLYIDRVLKTIYVIFKLIVIVFLLSHIVGLVFYALDYYFLTTGYYAPDFCWLISSTARNNIIDLEWPIQYLYTIYWGVNTITTISYGDIAPLNPFETNYAIIMFCLSFMVYGYVVNQIVKIIMWARGHKDQYRRQMIIMETYMDKMSITSDLRRKVRDYLNFIYTQEKNRDLAIEAEMKNKLPMELHQALIRSAYSAFNMKLNHIFHSQAATRFLFALEEQNYTSGEVVLNQGDASNRLYCMFKGYVRFQVNLAASGLTIFQLNAGNSIIGQFQFFKRDSYPFSCITNCPTSMYYLNYEGVIQQINKYPHLKEEHSLLLYQINFKHKFQRILYQCYFCAKEHDFRRCPKRLPQFSLLEINKHTKKIDSKRYPIKKFIPLKNRKMMKQLQKINKSGQKRLIYRIQKRINKIRHLLQQKNRDFQTDAVFDWEIYEPSWNFKHIKNQWNQKVEARQKQRQSKKTSNGKQMRLQSLFLREQ